MRLIINHLTRMQKGFICVAGVDLQTGRHIRPVLAGRLTYSLLARHGGAFEIGSEVELGPTTYVGHAPELEDYRFDFRKLSAVRTATAAEFWTLLQRQARPRLSDIFGPALAQTGPGAGTVPLREGNASLGCWIPNATPTLYLKKREGKPDQVRLSLPRGEFELDLSVTDIRLYGPDHVTANPTVITAVNDRLQRGVEVILAVGLSRPFSSTPDRPEVHWLQVNNLHLRDKPLWPLGK